MRTALIAQVCMAAFWATSACELAITPHPAATFIATVAGLDGMGTGVVVVWSIATIQVSVAALCLVPRLGRVANCVGSLLSSSMGAVAIAALPSHAGRECGCLSLLGMGRFSAWNAAILVAAAVVHVVLLRSDDRTCTPKMDGAGS